MKKKVDAGFTLIELMVIMAIIGIFASIVLVALGTARNKSTNSKVQAQLASMRSQAEIFFVNQSPNSYGTAVAGTACTGASAGSLFTTSASNYGLAALLSFPTGYSSQCYTDPTSGAASSWAVTASNNSTFASGDKFWCVDSSGKSASYSNVPTVSVATCP
jgi:type IV pilus assembly protein PilA